MCPILLRVTVLSSESSEGCYVYWFVTCDVHNIYYILPSQWVSVYQLLNIELHVIMNVHRFRPFQNATVQSISGTGALRIGAAFLVSFRLML